MNTQQGFIKYIVIIIIILIIVFLSQLAYFKGTGKTLISDATNQAGAYLSKGSDWVTSKIYPKIDEKTQSGGDTIKKSINQEKNKTSENILDKTKNYISGITDSIIHPGTPQNCQPTQTK